MIKTILIYILFLSGVYAFADAGQHGVCCKEELLQTLSENRQIRHFEGLGDLYHREGYRLLWKVQDIEDLIRVAKDRELNYRAYAYHTETIERLLAKKAVAGLDHAEAARLDLLAADQFLSLAKLFYEGEIEWHAFRQELEADPEKQLVWEPNPRRHDYGSEMLQALQRHRVYKQLKSYLPDEEAYRALVDAYRRYTKLRFPKIDYTKDLKQGDYGYEVTQLKHYLQTTGDLPQSDPKYLDFPTFDARLDAAVRRFQKRHYLKPNGIFDRVNVLYARRSAAEKARQIYLNIERYKLFPRVEEGTHLIINIPGFLLDFFRGNRLEREIGVVIGREDRPTPIFRDYLEYIVLNPTWSIPQNLMKKDYIPHLVEDPESLLADDIHIYQGGREIDPTKVEWSRYLDYEGKIPYQMVQKAGEKNVLGAMKFIFPNKYNVYLHDTNAKHLTSLRYRLYSSGCIRLSEPYVLLSLLSPYTGYSYAQLTDIIASGRTKHIRLTRRIPIHIRYLTAFVDQAGRVNFRKDFYGYDAMQQPLLEGK